jgi:flagellin-specific chaperone FliS
VTTLSWEKYSKNKILTSDALTIKIKLMQKCVSNMERLKVYTAEGKKKEANERIENTFAILQELILGNTIEDDGLRENINLMYQACINSLDKIHNQRMISKCDGIIHVLDDLIEAFKGVQNKDGQRIQE